MGTLNKLKIKLRKSSFPEFKRKSLANKDSHTFSVINEHLLIIIIIIIIIKLHFTKSHFLNIFWQYFDLGLYSDSFIYSEFHYSFTTIVTIEAQEKSTGKTLSKNYQHLATVQNTFTETEI